MKLILLILISIITCSCDKNDDLTAPFITEENTFSCKISGELFVAQPHGGFLQSEGILVMTSENKWLLRLTNAKGNHLYFNLIKNDSIDHLRILRSDGNTNFYNEMKNVIEYSGRTNNFISHNNTGLINVLEWENNASVMLSAN